MAWNICLIKFFTGVKIIASQILLQRHLLVNITKHMILRRSLSFFSLSFKINYTEVLNFKHNSHTKKTTTKINKTWGIHRRSLSSAVVFSYWRMYVILVSGFQSRDRWKTSFAQPAYVFITEQYSYICADIYWSPEMYQHLNRQMQLNSLNALSKVSFLKTQMISSLQRLKATYCTYSLFPFSYFFLLYSYESKQKRFF